WSPSHSRHLRQHRHNPPEQFPQRRKLRGRCEPQYFTSINDGRALESRTPRDGVVLCSVPAEPPVALGDVQRHREGCSSQLVPERRVSTRHLFGQWCDFSQESDCAAIDIELLKTEHAESSARGEKCC